MSQWNRSEEDLDTIELTDKELKSKIMDLNNKQLTNIKDMSYYYLISTAGELIELVEGKKYLGEIDSTEEKKILVESYHQIISSFKKFHNDMVEKEINEEISRLLDARERLHDLLMALYAYEIEISYIKELMDYHIMRRMSKIEYKKSNIDKTDTNLLIDKIRRTLENTKEYNVFVSIVSNILGIIPFRMSKSKYFDIVKATIIRNFSDYPVNVVKAQIDEYKILFDSRLVGNYGIMFDNYFTKVRWFANINPSSKTTDELESISIEIIQLSSEINKLNMFINDLGIMVNRLMVIYLTKNLNLSKMTITDIYENWEEYYNKKEKKLLDTLVKTSSKEIEKLEKKLLKGAEDLEQFNQEAVKRGGFDDEDFSDKILFTAKVLTYYNDLKFTRLDVLFPDKYEIIDKNYLIQLVDNLVQYMSRSISTIDNLEGKVRMRRFLSMLKLPFENIEEFFSYIDYSLDGRAISVEEVFFSIDAVYYLLEEYMERQ